MRNPRTGRHWRRVLGLALVAVLTLTSPAVALADAGTTNPPATARPSGTRVTARDLELRIAPTLTSDIITVIPEGSTVTLTGDLDAQFAKITYGDASGWVEAEFLLEGVSGTTAPTPAPTGFRTVSEDVNLRAEPSATGNVLTVLNAGTTVRVTGAVSGDYTEVTSRDVTGWVASPYLRSSSAGTVTPVPTATSTVGAADNPTVAPTVPATTTETTVPTETATTVATETPAPTSTAVEPTPTATQDLGVSTIPPTASATETVPPEPTATATGTVAATQPVTPTAAATEPPSSGNSLVVWPVKGGTWQVSQGYNGSSHQNNNDLWQYLDSFDLIPVNGEAAGQSVYSPVNGTIKWFDPSTGGIAIDMGGGLAFAMFHMDVDSGLREGQQVTQGQYLGIIAYPGSVNGGFPHLHITVWSTDDGGNWDRHAIPFTGNVAISGNEFPADGSSQQYTGYTFTP
ncbi:MAG: SH3 domain-containing protein [Thermomicrobiales bacterium]